MSMLAEKKRKQKWSLNPRGKAWAQDSNKFGQKMLEKMGWSQGKGLGAKEDGRTENIKVAYKNDSQGMGYKESDNQWTEHEANFSALLEALGGGQETSTTEIKLNSLEEKSQNSKARVHYKKFTRGKDLSRYSEKDLANIFGKKSLSEIKKVKQEKGPEMDKVVEKNNNFSNSGLMSDYFKKKLPNLGRTAKADDVHENNVSLHESESESELRGGFGFGFKPAKKFAGRDLKSSFISYVNEEAPSAKKKRSLQDDTSNIDLTPSKKKKLDDGVASKKNKSKKVKLGLTNPAFNPLLSPIKMEVNILEPIEENVDESLNLSLNDTVGQMAENFEVQAQIINEVTPVKRDLDRSLENVLKKKKKIGDKSNDMDMSYQNEDSGMDQCNNDGVKKTKKRKEKYGQEVHCTSLNSTADNSLAEVPAEKKKKRKKSKADSNEDLTPTSEEQYESPKKSKSKLGVDNPLFNIGVEHESVPTDADDNPYEVKTKQKKKKKKDKNMENLGMENPVFNDQDIDDENTQGTLNEEYEVKRKNKSSKKKNKKDKEENKGLDNPALNLNDSIEENCDLMLNVVAFAPISDPPLSIEKIKGVARRKSVRFSDVTRERIIPNKEQLESETLDASRDIVEIQGTLNDSSDLTYIDKFIQKKKAKKKNKGLENIAFDQRANDLEENISSISKTLDSYEAEIENDINEAKLKSVEIDDIMVGEVGNPDGANEKLPDGRVKLKFKYANFRKTSKYQETLTGSKKSYKHLIKGDIVMGFIESNLHEIEGYAVAKAS